MGSMAVLRFVSAWKVLPPLSHLSASTSHARWPPPPALRAARPSTGPAWTKEIPCGHGQGQSVHLDTGIMELRCCHRSGFGRREGPWLPVLGSPSDLLQNLTLCPAVRLLWQVGILPGKSLPEASSLGWVCPQPPPRANHAIPLPERSLTTDGRPLFPGAPWAWCSGAAASGPFLIPPPHGSPSPSWESPEFRAFFQCCSSPRLPFNSSTWPHTVSWSNENGRRCYCAKLFTKWKTEEETVLCFPVRNLRNQLLFNSFIFLCEHKQAVEITWEKLVFTFNQTPSLQIPL